MKPTINNQQTACRLLAALFFFLLLAPMAAGEEVSPTDSNWKDYLNGVERIANDKGGTGESWESPILIASAEELAYFAQQVNKGEAITYGNGSGTAQIESNGKHEAGGFLGYYFALSADIYLEDHYWTPIGTENKPFKAYFDGRGHCVSGLKVKVKVKENVYEKSDPAYAGLFGNAHSGTIQNLGVRLAEEGVQATTENGSAYAGGIAGKAKIIYCCYVEGPGSVKAVSSKREDHINSGSYAGGIVGYLFDYPILTHCYATVAVKAVSNSNSHAGGIAGWGTGILSYTYATGAVEATGAPQNNYAGGICGYAQSPTIENNLALNDFIKGNENWSNRIVGFTGINTTLTTNYASPEIVVNGKTVSGGTDGDAKGDPNVNLDIFDKVFNGGAGWDTSDKTHLPKLNIRTGDGPNYAKWPTGEDFTPQSPPDATQYLQDEKIANINGGDGSEGKPILIANRAELAYLAKQLNAGKDLVVSKNVDGDIIKNEGEHENFKDIYFALANDIVLNDYWTPIGTDNPFKGNFDGQGHCVRGLKVDVNENSGYTYAGLFGNAENSTLQNLGVHLAEEGVRITDTNNTGGLSCAGGIAGQALNVHNCYVVGDGSIEIKGGDAGDGGYAGYAGGIVGALTSQGSLTNCYATVDIKIENKGERHAGGIVGYCNFNSTISYTYATGDVNVGTGEKNYYAGGICGYLSGATSSTSATSRTSSTSSIIENSLALNGRITGGDDYSNRIVGKKDTDATLTTNYASLEMEVNGKTFPDNQADNENGVNTLLSSFQDDLLPDPNDQNNGWATSWTFTPGYLPQLKKKTADSYETWGSEQPQLNASRYLPARLYIVSPTGGTLTVTDETGNSLIDGSTVISGTVLTLTNTPENGNVLDTYLVSSDGSSFTDHSDGSIEMPNHDLYLSASFIEEQKPEPEEPPYVPPVPIYYNVYLPQVEGASTDPGSGEYEVESWSTFRFYLTIDSAYSESQPVVTTDRGETLEPRSSDGAYLVKYVRTDVEVFIDGLVQNPPPVANEAISTDALAPQIWAEGTMLCIRMPEALPSAPVRIFTVDGRLYDSFASTPGLNRRPLPTGIYIVRVEDTACKVIIK